MININNTTKETLTQENIKDIVHRLPFAAEIISAQGESAGVTCPKCGCREFPQRQTIDQCRSCGQIYRIPQGYYGTAQKRQDNLNNILSNILSQEQREAGLTLQQDDHNLALMYGEKIIALFTYNASIEAVRHEADHWLEMRKAVTIETDWYNKYLKERAC